MLVIAYSLGHYTRDTFGMAVKATHTVINGKEVQIYKDPKTDTSKLKKSQKGMVVVYEGEDGLTFEDGLDSKRLALLKEHDLLKPVFEDGELLVETTLAYIRAKVRS